MFNNIDKSFMRQAIELANKARDFDEVPVGAVIVLDNNVIGKGYNKPIKDIDPTSHAEINAIRDAAQTIKNYRLVNTTMYVTLEPCIMCIGAIIQARISRIIFGAKDKKYGSLQSIEGLKFNHQVKFDGLLLEKECAAILSEFFKQKRK